MNNFFAGKPNQRFSVCLALGTVTKGRREKMKCILLQKGQKPLPVHIMTPILKFWVNLGFGSQPTHSTQDFKFNKVRFISIRIFMNFHPFIKNLLPIHIYVYCVFFIVSASRAGCLKVGQCYQLDWDFFTLSKKSLTYPGLTSIFIKWVPFYQLAGLFLQFHRFQRIFKNVQNLLWSLSSK